MVLPTKIHNQYEPIYFLNPQNETGTRPPPPWERGKGGGKGGKGGPTAAAAVPSYPRSAFPLLPLPPPSSVLKVKMLVKNTKY
jgi:hypothetical protein